MEPFLLWIAAFLILFLLSINLWRRPRNIPPGPWGLPFLGYYPFLGKTPYKKLNENAKIYGDVMSFRTVGGKLIIVLNGLDAIKEVFYTRSDEFIGRPLEYNLLEWVSDGIGVAQEEGSPWKDHRRFFLSKVKDYGFGKTEIEDHMHDLIQQMIRDLKGMKGKPIELLTHVSHVTMNVIAEILFKKQIRKDHPDFSVIAQGLHTMVSIFTGSTHFLVGPFIRYVIKFTKVGRASQHARDILKAMVDDIVKEHIRTFDPRHLRDFVDAFLEHMRTLEEKGQLHGSSFTKERLEWNAMNMWLEGTESVAGNIFGLLVAIAKYPDIQIKVQQELDTVIGRDRLPSWTDKANLPYFDAVISELNRTHQVFFLSTMYSNFEETKLHGYTIPKRSIIVANFWSINNDPKIHANPEKFDPDRFLGSDKKRLSKEGIAPFGLGKRACIGESLAQMEVFVVIASILQHFVLHPAGEEKVRAVAR